MAATKKPLMHPVQLDAESRLVSRLWLDRPDASDRIQERCNSGRLTDEEAGKLRQFAEEGYFLCRAPISPSLADRLSGDIDRFWHEKPIDLAYSFIRDPRSMADSHERRERRPTYRLYNLHSHSDAACELYLHAGIFHWIGLVLDAQPIALDSVFGEFGSRQPFVRDAVYVDSRDPSQLVSAWIPLEEVDLKNGPPVLIPGSQRLPFHQFEPGRVSIGLDEDYLEAYRFIILKMRDAGLNERVLTMGPGEVLIRHAGLVHGAKPVREAHRTRRYLEVHFTVKGVEKARGAAYRKLVRGRLWQKEERFYWNETERLLERDGRTGFDSPLKGLAPRGLSLLEKIRNRLGGGASSPED